MTLIPEHIIKEAIRNGGYDLVAGMKLTFPYREAQILLVFIQSTNSAQPLVLLDPLFWSALGKARGWRVCPMRHAVHAIGCEPYLSYAVGFVELLLTSPTQEQVDQFWRDLP